ncbi:MAG: hypothetical protein AAF533_28415 [Acidobacteriota bacterium]
MVTPPDDLGTPVEPSAVAATRRPRPGLRALIGTWELLAGYVLTIAPLTSLVFNETFFAWRPGLQRLLLAWPARLVISAVGLGLLLRGAWELASLLGTPREQA